MKVINIQFPSKNEIELENKVLPLLKNHVFHVTTYSAYQNILKDKLIKPNKNKLKK